MRGPHGINIQGSRRFMRCFVRGREAALSLDDMLASFQTPGASQNAQSSGASLSGTCGQDIVPVGDPVAQGLSWNLAQVGVTGDMQALGTGQAVRECSQGRPRVGEVVQPPLRQSSASPRQSSTSPRVVAMRTRETQRQPHRNKVGLGGRNVTRPRLWRTC